VVHYLVNGAALKVGLIVAVILIAGLLRVFVPAPLRMAVAGSPAWVQAVAGLQSRPSAATRGTAPLTRYPLLWRLHRVHRSIRDMDWLAANHLNPLDVTFVRSCRAATALRAGLRSSNPGCIRHPYYAAGHLHSRQRADELRPAAMADHHPAVPPLPSCP
jgi:hypothetical protein